jgi:preprotein translocase subunit SecE
MEKVTTFLRDTAQFFREVKVELQKVTFPTRQETVGSTIVVLILTVILATYLGFSDWARQNRKNAPGYRLVCSN